MPFPPPKAKQPAAERAPFREPDQQLSPAMRKQKARADALRKRAKAPPASPPDPGELGSG